jgi:hypothetical protein
LKSGCWHAEDRRLGADRDSLTKRGPGRQVLKPVVADALPAAQPRAPFFEDDLSLAVDLLGCQIQAHGDIAQEEHALLKRFGLGVGEGELKRGLVKARERVLVLAECEPERLKKGDHRTPGGSLWIR